jgi:diguanylate cyclase (GGDEF)-like protein
LREISPRPSAPARLALTAATLAVIAGIGWIDYRTGPEYGLSLLYLVPITASAWWLGALSGLASALAASVAWILADVAWHDTPGPSTWNGFTRVAIYVGAAWVTNRLHADRAVLRQLLKAEQQLSRTDPVTRLPNARSFLETLASEIARTRQHLRPLCVAYLDVDGFKNVNDLYGHAAGDELLGRIGALIRDSVRISDVPARMGGDEFAILFWDVERHEAEEVARRLVAGVERLGSAHPGAEPGASVGIAWFRRPPADPQEVLTRADEAMYRAKFAGRNRLSVWSDEPHPPAPPTAAAPPPRTRRRTDRRPAS